MSHGFRSAGFFLFQVVDLAKLMPDRESRHLDSTNTIIPAVNTDNDTCLIDGSSPLTSDGLLALLDAEGIRHHTVSHAPMWTVEDAKAIRTPAPHGHTKNLFVRNRKGRMWLLTLHEDRQVDLKTLGVMIGADRLSFASPQRLMQYLGVTPGAVSMFSVLNDVTRVVTCWIDETLLQAPKLHVHPLINTRTTTMDREVLLAFLAKRGYPFEMLRFV